MGTPDKVTAEQKAICIFDYKKIIVEAKGVIVSNFLFLIVFMDILRVFDSSLSIVSLIWCFFMIFLFVHSTHLPFALVYNLSYLRGILGSYF